MIKIKKIILNILATFICLNSYNSALALNEEISLNELNMLENTVFSLHNSHWLLQYKKPTSLHESVIASDKTLAVSYNGLNNRIQIVITLLADPEFNQTIQDYQTFKHFVLRPFRDKENMMYGQYRILEEENTPKNFVLTLTGYLKKQADGILPEMYNVLYEKVINQGEVSARMLCQIQGSQAQQRESQHLFNKIEPLCRNIAQSIKLEQKSK